MAAVSELGCRWGWGWASDRAEFFRSLTMRLGLSEVSRDTRALAAETAAWEVAMEDGLGGIKWGADVWGRRRPRVGFLPWRGIVGSALPGTSSGWIGLRCSSSLNCSSACAISSF